MKRIIRDLLAFYLTAMVWLLVLVGALAALMGPIDALRFAVGLSPLAGTVMTMAIGLVAASAAAAALSLGARAVRRPAPYR